jgi:F0F1-type ATP synthase membrane subunit b/b'
MKRPSRELNIFSMSALDLFASAMGAFILLTVILFPYYQKNAKIVEDLNKTKNQLAQAQQQLSDCQAQQAALQNQLSECQTQQAQTQRQLQECEQANSQNQNQMEQCEQARQQCEQQRQTCEEKLSRTFLAVVMKWATSQQDVDLHVIDTQGREYYYQQKRFSGSEAELSVDTTRGPGIEIWENPHAKVGEYKVYANLYARNDNEKNPKVLTTVYYRDGSKKLRNITLSAVQQKKLVAIIKVNSDGEVHIQNP